MAKGCQLRDALPAKHKRYKGLLWKPFCYTDHMNEQCFFCKIQHDDNAVLYENSLLFLVLDGFPVSPGHGLLVPKRHVANLSDVTADEWRTYYLSIQESIKAIELTDLKAIYTAFFEKATSDIGKWFNRRALEHPHLGMKPDAHNHGLNDGTAAGRTVDHLHWHIIPRYAGDMADPRGGIRYVIPEMGNYKTPRA